MSNSTTTIVISVFIRGMLMLVGVNVENSLAAEGVGSRQAEHLITSEEVAFKKLSTEISLLPVPSSSTGAEKFQTILNDIDHLPIVAASSDSGGFKRQRDHKVRLLLRLMAKVDSGIDLQFDPNRDIPTLNVMPPDGANVSAGTSPEAIADPEIRRKYEQLIEENCRKMERSRVQFLLRRMHQQIPQRQLYSTIQATFDELSISDERELQLLFREEVKDDNRRDQLLKGLAAYRRIRIPGTESRRAVPPGAPLTP